MNYHLVSFELYAQSTLHHVSKHNLILKTNQFIDVRCKKWGDLTIFSKFSTVIFITISAWCQRLWIFQCNSLRKWLQILQRDWIIENIFFKVSRLCSRIMQSVLLVLLQGCFKKVGIQFKRNNVLNNEDEEY